MAGAEFQALLSTLAEVYGDDEAERLMAFSRRRQGLEPDHDGSDFGGLTPTLILSLKS